MFFLLTFNLIFFYRSKKQRSMQKYVRSVDQRYSRTSSHHFEFCHGTFMPYVRNGVCKRQQKSTDSAYSSDVSHTVKTTVGSHYVCCTRIYFVIFFCFYIENRQPIISICKISYFVCGLFPYIKNFTYYDYVVIL